MFKNAVYAAVVAALLLSACGGSDSPYGDLDPVRAIEQLDDQGRPYLSPWDVDPAVADLQQKAADRGLPVAVTGVYDDETLAVVLAFQYSQDLVPDGIIGPNTWDAIDNPKELPENVDALTLVEIATVAADSPSDARQMLTDLGLPLPVGAPVADDGDVPVEPGNDAPPSAGDETPSSDGDQTPAPGGDEAPVAVPDGMAATAVVHLSSQQVDLLDSDGDLMHRFPISSGRDGLTPVGVFKVQSKSDVAYSATDYPEISMQWMTRFNGGIGFHGIPVKNGNQLDTPLGVAPVSAGCVRLADADAKVLYDVLSVGADVVVEA